MRGFEWMSWRFWPLLPLIVACTAIVWKISPATMSILPWKIDLLLISILVSHIIDRAFRLRPEDAMARAIVFFAVVEGMTRGL